jgi:SAM-dependent methyltransferase
MQRKFFHRHLHAIQADIQTKGYRASLLNYWYEFTHKAWFRKRQVQFPDLSWKEADTREMSAHKDAHANQFSSFYIIEKAFHKIPLPASEISMLDIGCGCGRAMVVGMKNRFKKVSGVELDPDALFLAERNCQHMFRHGFKTPYELKGADASNCRIPEGTNVIYLFNPFGIKTMHDVVENITRQIKDWKTDIYIIYYNPVYEDTFITNPIFRRIYNSWFIPNKRKEMSIFLASVFGRQQTMLPA